MLLRDQNSFKGDRAFPCHAGKAKESLIAVNGLNDLNEFSRVL